MPITPSAGQTVNVYAGITGTLPVSLSGVLTASITGTVAVSATNPVTASISNFPTTFPLPPQGSIVTASINDSGGSITVDTGTPGQPLNVTGSVYVINQNSASLTVSGTISVTSTLANPVWITGSVNANVPATQSVTGTVYAFQTGTWNATVTSTLANPVWITGTVNASVPSTQSITGTVNVTGGMVAVVNAPGVSSTLTQSNVFLATPQFTLSQFTTSSAGGSTLTNGTTALTMSAGTGDNSFITTASFGPVTVGPNSYTYEYAVTATFSATVPPTQVQYYVGAGDTNYGFLFVADYSLGFLFAQLYRSGSALTSVNVGTTDNSAHIYRIVANPTGAVWYRDGSPLSSSTNPIADKALAVRVVQHPISGTPVTKGLITGENVVGPFLSSSFLSGGFLEVNITGTSITLPVSATNPVTASVSNFPTGFNANITASIVLPVSATNPITASITNFPVTQSVFVVNAQGSNVNITGSIPLPISGSVFTSGGLDVWVLNQTSSSLSGVNVVSGGLQVFASQSNPVWVTGAFSTTGGNSVYVYSPNSAVQTSVTGVLSSALYNTSSFLLLPVNLSRSAYAIYNSSSAELFIGVVSPTNSGSYSYRLAPRSVYEAPEPNYQGTVYVAWGAGGGVSDQLLVTTYIAEPLSASVTTSLYVTSTLANPLYVTGALTTNVTLPPIVTVSGTIDITASITLPVSATNPVTASISNFPNGFLSNITASITLPVSATNPVTASVSNFPTGFNANVTASIPLTVNVNTGTLAGAISGSPQPVKALVSASDASVTLVANAAYRVVATTDGYLRDGGTADNTYHPFFSKIPEVWAFGGTTIHVILSASAATGSIWFSRII